MACIDKQLNVHVLVQLSRDGLILIPLTDTSDRSQIISNVYTSVYGSVLCFPDHQQLIIVISLFLRDDPIRLCYDFLPPDLIPPNFYPSTFDSPTFYPHNPKLNPNPQPNP